MTRCLLLPLCGLVMISGCTKPATPPAAAGPAGRKKFLLAEEPAGAVGVKQTKTDNKDADEVTVVGRIGSAEDP